MWSVTVMPMPASGSIMLGMTAMKCRSMPTSMLTSGMTGRKSACVRIELVLRRRLATDADVEHAGFGGAFDAGKIATQRAEFPLFLVELLGGRVNDFQLGPDFVSHGHSPLVLGCGVAPGLGLIGEQRVSDRLDF